MSEVLFEAGGINVTITAVYSVISVIVLLLFMSLWLAGKKKRTGRDIFAGQVMNGIGFGILPALAVLKAFQEAGTGKGARVLEPLPCVRWLSVGGYYMPGRIETAAAAVLFILLCLWLILRKSELPDNGDLYFLRYDPVLRCGLVHPAGRDDPDARQNGCGPDGDLYLHRDQPSDCKTRPDHGQRNRGLRREDRKRRPDADPDAHGRRRSEKDPGKNGAR